MLIGAGGAGRKARHPVGNQMSIGSEKDLISADRARNGKLESVSSPAKSLVRT
jgi:hypothetical protein